MAAPPPPPDAATLPPTDETPTDETPYQRDPGYPAWYHSGRFQVGSGPRTDKSERKVLRRLLQDLQAPPPPDLGHPLWLDVPAGAGRLTGELPGRAVAVDREPGMLRAADGSVHLRVCASAHRLPFPEGTFSGVLCVRLLQHIPAGEERIVILKELARVSRGPVIVTFFDAATLPAWRRRRRQRKGGRVGSRGAFRRADLMAEAAAAGLRVARFAPIRWRLSEQCFALLLPDPRPV